MSADLRRDAGIAAALLAIVHVAAALQNHFGGNWFAYFFELMSEETENVVRTDGFGVANYLGLTATIVVLFLLALSNDLALRALGTARWKWLQRLNYPGFALVAVHTLLFQQLVNRSSGYVVATIACLGFTALLQGTGFVLTRRKRRARS